MTEKERKLCRVIDDMAGLLRVVPAFVPRNVHTDDVWWLHKRAQSAYNDYRRIITTNA